jgi:ParB-like chromosome segregation protein Spo0J
VTTVSEIPIAQIQVNGRIRHDAGDLQPLIDSIERVGLLHPIVLSTDGHLLCGQRRLMAFQAMGRTTIPATVAYNASDALSAYQAERDENTCRKNFTPSEYVRFGLILEEFESAEAKNRQLEAGSFGKDGGRGKRKTLPQNFRKGLGETRTKVAAALGIVANNPAASEGWFSQIVLGARPTGQLELAVSLDGEL